MTAQFAGTNACSLPVCFSTRKWSWNKMACVVCLVLRGGLRLVATQSQTPGPTKRPQRPFASLRTRPSARRKPKIDSPVASRVYFPWKGHREAPRLLWVSRGSAVTVGALCPLVPGREDLHPSSVPKVNRFDDRSRGPFELKGTRPKQDSILAPGGIHRGCR